MLIAKLNDNTAAAGTEILFEKNTFIIQNRGMLTLEQVIQLDKKKALDWATPEIKEKVIGYYNQQNPMNPYLAEVDIILEDKGAESSSDIKKKKIKPIWIIIAVLIILLLGLSGFVGYTFFMDSQKTADNSVETTSTVETSDTNLKPSPLEYDFNKEAASKVINDYIAALNTRDYGAAYSLLDFSSLEDVRNKPSEESWSNLNKEFEYSTLSTGSVSPLDFESLISDEETVSIIPLQGVIKDIEVKNLYYQGAPEWELVWNKQTDTYKINDGSAVIQHRETAQTFNKQEDLTKSVITVNDILLTTKKFIVIWDYNDNGSAGGIPIVYNNEVRESSLNQTSVAAVLNWKGESESTLPQNISGNVVFLDFNSDVPASLTKDYQVSFQPDFTRNNNYVAAKVEFTSKKP